MGEGDCDSEDFNKITSGGSKNTICPLENDNGERLRGEKEIEKKIVLFLLLSMLL